MVLVRILRTIIIYLFLLKSLFAEDISKFELFGESVEHLFLFNYATFTLVLFSDVNDYLNIETFTSPYIFTKRSSTLNYVANTFDVINCDNNFLFFSDNNNDVIITMISKELIEINRLTVSNSNQYNNAVKRVISLSENSFAIIRYLDDKIYFDIITVNNNIILHDIKEIKVSQKISALACEQYDDDIICFYSYLFSAIKTNIVIINMTTYNFKDNSEKETNINLVNRIDVFEDN